MFIKGFYYRVLIFLVERVIKVNYMYTVSFASIDCARRINEGFIYRDGKKSNHERLLRHCKSAPSFGGYS